MKRRETNNNSIEVFPSYHSAPYYELEWWTKIGESSKEEAQKELENLGYIDANYRIDKIGVFETKERALSRLRECLDIVYEMEEEDYFGPPYFFLREKPMYVMMDPHDYIKEWTYLYSFLEDESLVRNYCTSDYPFMGRPKEMIRHKVGDIVMVLEGNNSFWGVVYGVPRIYDGKPHGDYSDDQYTIYTSAGVHYHCLAHHVLSSGLYAPEYVEELLRAEFNDKVEQ